MNFTLLIIVVALGRFSSQQLLCDEKGFPSGQKTEIAVHGVTIHSSDNVIAQCSGELDSYCCGDWGGEEGFKFTFVRNPKEQQKKA